MQPVFRPSQELFPFRSHWFASRAGGLHYIDEGQGRPIVLLHGNPTWCFLYREIVRRLRTRFRCVAVDYPGFGLSDRPEDYGYTPAEHAEILISLIDHLALDDVIIMGQDWGGPIGIACARADPDRVTGFVFGNTWFWPTDRLVNKLFSRLMSTSLMRWAMLEHNFFVERLIPAGTARDLPPEVMAHYRGVQPDRAARIGVAEFPRQLRAAGPWLAELARTVPRQLAGKPLLLVWGMRDFAFAPRHFLPRWTSAFHDWSLVELHHAKHFIQEDAPEEIAEAVIERFG